MDISVVIGFKDWGVERLLLSVESILTSFEGIEGEVIVSDFGSTTFETGELEDLVTSAGARYVRTETDGQWSRSRAVNAGYSVAEGEVLVATDADMLFTPRSMVEIYRAVILDPLTAVVLQCRDLPQAYDHVAISEHSPSWSELHAVSQIRPRWGMGGMFALHRSVVGALGGYDNRMHTYGGEDLDFAVRTQRYGCRIHWLEKPNVRMYHIWHPPTIKSVEASTQGKDAVAANRAILTEDRTFKRNCSAGLLDRFSISWAQRAFTILEGPVEEATTPKTTFTVFAPAGATLRSRGFNILSNAMTAENRAVVSQAVSIGAGSGGGISCQPEHSIPVLALDSRLVPLVIRYFQYPFWNIHGALAALQAARVHLKPLNGAVFALPETAAQPDAFAETAWSRKFQENLLPSQLNQEEARDLIEDLPPHLVASLQNTVNIHVRYQDKHNASVLEFLQHSSDEWRRVENEGSPPVLEAVFLDVESDVYGQLIEHGVSQDSFEIVGLAEAVRVMEKLREEFALPTLLEEMRQEAGFNEALLVAWTETANTGETSGMIKLRTKEQDWTVWSVAVAFDEIRAAHSIVDLFPEETSQWARGIYTPAPVEAVVLGSVSQSREVDEK